MPEHVITERWDHPGYLRYSGSAGKSLELQGMGHSLDAELTELVRRALEMQKESDDQYLRSSHLYRLLIGREPWMTILNGTRSFSDVDSWVANRADSVSGDSHSGWETLKNLESSDGESVGVSALWDSLLTELLNRPAKQYEPALTRQMVETYHTQRQLETAFFGDPNDSEVTGIRLLGSQADAQEADRLIDDLVDGIKKFADLDLPLEVVRWFEDVALDNLSRLRILVSNDAPSSFALSGMASEAREITEGTRNSFGATYGWLKDKGSDAAGLAAKANSLADLIKNAIDVIPKI